MSEALSSQKTVLFVDDQAGLWLTSFNRHLAKFGFRFVGEEDPSRVLERVDEVNPDVILLDIVFPAHEHPTEAGRLLLAKIKESHPQLPVVMITATLADDSHPIDENDYPDAHFLFAKDRFEDSSPDANPYLELATQLSQAIQEAGKTSSFDARCGFVVGETDAMREVARTIIRVASQDCSVMIAGETGTGKELVASAIHRLSGRNQGALVAVNCGSLTDDVLESTLFGHEKGAFTGADRPRKGLLEKAHGGTLFLDEVEAMSAGLQEKLLRALETKCIRRMGATTEIPLDFRIISATNQDIPALIREKRFREDLYYRLKVVQIVLPPLRQRLGDLPRLFEHLVLRINRKLHKSISTRLRADVSRVLTSYHWPGNIRELENTLENAILLSRSNILTPGCFSALQGTDPGLIGANQERLIKGWVDEITRGNKKWIDIRTNFSGETRKAILAALMARIAESEGAGAPLGTRLAHLLGVKRNHLSQILMELNLRLRV